MGLPRRKKIWIDRFQTYLSLRLALYFAIYQAAVWAFALIERRIFDGLTGVAGEGLATLCLLFFTLIVVFVGLLFIYDAVHVAHRLVGPLYRFRKTVQAITADEKVDLVQLRRGDFLQEFKDDFNEMLEALERRGAIVIQRGETPLSPSKSVSVCAAPRPDGLPAGKA